MQANINVYQAYQKNKYETASPHRLILMLYDGAIRFANKAILCIRANDIEDKNKYILKFQEVIYELMSSLNFNEGKEIADSLLTIYSYTIDLSTQSNLNMIEGPLVEAINILNEIREAWIEMGKEVYVNGR